MPAALAPRFPVRFRAEKMRHPLISKAAVGLALLLSTRPLLAQDPSGGAPLPVASTDANDAAVAPVLQAHPDPVYPEGALRDRISGTVGLELVVDEAGHVVDAKVVQPAGHGFDEAALTAVKSWSFAPARQNDAPIRATVQLSLPFEPPPPTPATVDAPPAVVPPAAPAPVAQKNTETTLVLGRKPISAAS